MRSRRSTTTVLTATALVALLAGCSGNDQPEVVAPASTSTSPPDSSQATTPPDNASATTSPMDTSHTTSDAGATSAPEDSGSSTSDASDTTLPTVPADYADALVQAWGSGDRARMEALGTAEVLHILGDQGGPHWDQTSVEGATGSTIVTYTNTDSGDTLELRVENEAASQGAEQSVVEARYTAAADAEDAVPTVPTDYADSLVVAWGTDDQATMERLATPEVIDTLGTKGSPHWERISAEGAAGSTIVTYRETESGEVLSLRVENELASQGGEHAVVEARFESS
ncbi:hypothetical protein FNH13_06420 [Ornithinimicrobium ciconiae]|uniref:Uncharacterized protein n=1 Tax=Ornithinimicrobium ciconiae TaxID=2594265 RepID=A0A516G922_9MICO|nr:hypothetical protein [Ornithinimicrobium ciconiae]QDO88027.1 hypothetical protein FNH13_06420 [Ornithinimicrobium ciconiae]